ncbi:MAG: coenzyme F420-0:L-glutamate ligase, partial [Pseudolabrys sp.]
MPTPPRLTLSGVPDIPLIAPGDDLGAIIAAAMDRASLACADGDIIVVAQKVVSKAQGRFVDLATVRPSDRALAIAADTDRDPRLVEVILSESVNVLRSHKRALVVEHRDGFVMANAGVDRSNVMAGGSETVLLLPTNPDGAAAALRATLEAHFHKTLGVVINDSFGRPWRR